MSLRKNVKTDGLGEPVFFRRNDILTLEEAGYYQDLLYRTIKIGTELEFALPKGIRRADFQPRIEELLAPSRDMNRMGRLGVFDVVKEHCGVEVQIMGRHPHWDMLLRQYQQIITPLLEQGVRMRPTCGLHFHIIGIGLAEPIPEIILANLWNISRTYAPGLKYLTSGGESLDGLCRRRQNNAHQEFMRHSPVHKRMNEIQDSLKRSLDVPEHQNFFNLEHLRFARDGAINKFHVELRFPDGDLSAVSVTAKAFLFLVMVLKSVEISKFGLLHVGKTREWNRKRELMDLISNNDGELATSDTSGISRETLNEYREIARQLLWFLKSVFIVLDNPAEMVLQNLARQPVSLRRSRGDDWRKINDDLLSLAKPQRKMDEMDYKIIKIIELGLVEEENFTEWIRLAAVKSGISKERIRDRMSTYKKREPVWDSTLGRVVFSR